MSPSTKPRYKGVFPVVPTTFDDRGALDLESQKRCVDVMIDAGSNGLCILANFSEQLALADEEQQPLTAAILGHVAGRVPVTQPLDGRPWCRHAAGLQAEEIVAPLVRARGYV